MRFICFKITSILSLTVFFITVLFGIIALDFLDCYYSSNKVRDNYERVDFLNSLGVDANAEAIIVKSIIIPEKINMAYNDIQIKAGYNLTFYAGQSATLYTYKTYADYYVNLIIKDNKIIGGDISCYSDLDGIYPLKKGILDEKCKT